MTKLPDDPLTIQCGFGIAAYQMILALFNELEDNGTLTFDRRNEITEFALQHLETIQSVSPLPDAVTTARIALEAALAYGRLRQERGKSPSTEEQT